MVEHKPVSLNVHVLQSKCIDTELPRLLIHWHWQMHRKCFLFLCYLNGSHMEMYSVRITNAY